MAGPPHHRLTFPGPVATGSPARRLGYLLLLLIVVTLAAGGVVLAMLYSTAMDSEREQLVAMARSHARLIGSMAASSQDGTDASRADRGAAEAKRPAAPTVSQLAEAIGHEGGFRSTGELLLGRHEGSRVLIMLPQEGMAAGEAIRIPRGDHVAAPLMRALDGHTGFMVSRDRHHNEVLAAYAPIADTGWALVARRQLDAIQAPFIEAAVTGGGVGAILILLGAWRFVRTTNPLIARLAQSEARYRELIETAEEGVLALDPGNHVALANPKAGEILGGEPERLQGRSIFEIMPRELHPQLRERIEQVRLGRRQTFELSVPRGDHLQWLHVAASPIRGRGGHFAGILSVGTDITERKSLEQQLERSERFLRRVLQTLPVGTWVADEQGNFLLTNPAGRAIWAGADKVGPEGYAGFKGWWPGTGEPIAAHDWAMVRALDRGETTLDEVVEIQAFDGTRKLVRHSAAPVHGDDGALWGAIVVAEDITEQRHAQIEMRRLYNAIEQAADAILTLDTDLRVVYANPAFEQTTGFDSNEASGRRLEGFLDQTRHDAHYMGRLHASVRSGEVFRDVLVGRRKDGRRFSWEATFTPVRDETGAVHSIVASGSDITDQEAMQTRLYEMTRKDLVTELPNRTRLAEHLEQSIVRSARHHRTVALMLLDVDDFKVVNEGFGHETGDMLLRQFGDRVAGCVREGDLVARIGADEFGVLLDDLATPGDTALVAEKINRCLTQPFLVEGQEVFLDTSIGIALVPDDGSDAATLLRHANMALSEAKLGGGRHYEYYAAKMALATEERVTLHGALRHALDRDELELHFQPQIDLKRGCVRGVEALLRWSQRDWGPISPARFIPLAEETGLILPIGEWVLRTALEQAQQWRGQGLPGLIISVNVSPRQFADPGLVDQIEQVLSRTGMPAGALEIEITEGTVMSQTQQVGERLRAIKSLGVSLSVDDFGVGYSSLAYLSRLPLDILKIDRSFVTGLFESTHEQSIVRAIVSLAHNLNLKVIAEGVETDDQLHFLEGVRCDMVQGFLLARPIPAGQVSGQLQGLCDGTAGPGRREVIPFPSRPGRD